MAAVLLSATLTCLAALFLGQALLRLVGAREWSWLAPPVGLSLAMLVAAPTASVPGKATTMAVLLAALGLAAAVWCLRSPPHRPPSAALLAALPVLFLALVPFIAAERGGIMGVTVNNDMAIHLKIAESFLSAAAADAYPLPGDYPLGPHAMVAALSRGLGIGSELAFSGWTLALPLIGAWTVLAAARRASWLGKAIAATVAGMPFLIAAYYGQGAFKEVAQAVLVLAVVLLLSGCGPALGRTRWVPFAVLVGGIVSVYSPAGLVWVAAIVVLWLAGLLAIEVGRGRLREVPGALRRELPAIGVGVGALLLALLPQAHRMWEFLALRDGTGITLDNIGNLVARLPGWEALGIWDNADFRLPATPAFSGGAWSWFVVALILFGAFWAFRRGRWLLPLAAGGALLIWEYSDGSQSIYVTAKALVIASPLLLLLAALPLLDRGPRSQSPRLRALWLLAPLLGLVLLFKVVESDLRALRFSPVGPTDHAEQLIGFRPLIEGGKTLFFGEDEFAHWTLVGSQMQPIALSATSTVPLRPQKRWEFGKASDFDSLPAAALNEYEWFVLARSAAMSAPPPQLRLVRSSDDFELWRRVGRVRERSILVEGEWPGAVLACDTERGRALLARGGVAAVRRPPLAAPPASVLAGDTATLRLRLPAGSWQLEASYVSPRPVEVTAPGLRTTLPANLERTGPRFLIGRIVVPRTGPVAISFAVDDTWLAPDTAAANFTELIAAPVGAKERIVPIERACGRYVDWYRLAPS